MHAVSFILVTRPGWGKVLGTFSSPVTSPSLSALTMVTIGALPCLVLLHHSGLRTSSLLHIRYLIHVERREINCETCPFRVALSNFLDCCVWKPMLLNSFRCRFDAVSHLGTTGSLVHALTDLILYSVGLVHF